MELPNVNWVKNVRRGMGTTVSDTRATSDLGSGPSAMNSGESKVQELLIVLVTLSILITIAYRGRNHVRVVGPRNPFGMWMYASLTCTVVVTLHVLASVVGLADPIGTFSMMIFQHTITTDMRVLLFVAVIILAIIIHFVVWPEPDEPRYTFVWGPASAPTLVDARDMTRKIGAPNLSTNVCTLDLEISDDATLISFNGRVNRSFIEETMLNHPARVTLQDAMVMYGLDRASNLSNQTRLELRDATVTCLVHMYNSREIDIARINRQTELAGNLSATTSRLESKRLYKSTRVILKHKPLFIFVAVLVPIVVALSSTTIKVNENYLTSHDQEFKPAEFRAPPNPKRGFKAKMGTRKKTRPTGLESLLPSKYVPKILNQSFDRNSPMTAWAAARYRLAADNGKPDYSPDIVKLIDTEIDALVTKYNHDTRETRILSPLNPDDVHSWIDSRPYTQVRKAQLHKSAGPGWNRNSDFEVDPHIKEEAYPKPSRPRFICARRDEAKTLLGPIFDGPNHWVFHQPFATKHIRASERPKYIDNLLEQPESRYFVTDHNQFEAAFTPEVQRQIEHKFYRGVIPLQYHALLDELLKDRDMVHYGTNTRMHIPAMRFSGDMNTSLGNTIANYVSLQVAAKLQHESITCVVEGDDSLFRASKSFDVARFQSTMVKMGFSVKIDEVDSPSKAGYCSSKWTASQKPVPDPTKFIPNMLWSSPSSIKTYGRTNILASKLASYATECPNMPIVWKMYRESTRTNFTATLNQYELEYYKNFAVVIERHHDYEVTVFANLWQEPTLELRTEFCELYGLSIAEQLGLELMYDNYPGETLCKLYELLGGDVDFTSNVYHKSVV